MLPTFSHAQKHIDLDSEVDYFKDEDLLNFQTTEIHMEGSEFGMEGGINFKKNIFLDLIFTGKKPNFDLLIAFAPEEQIPTLKSYKNKGELFIQANIKGESINGHNPDVKIVFNCKNGEIINRENGRTLKDINFSGFTLLAGPITPNTSAPTRANWQSLPRSFIRSVTARSSLFPKSCPKPSLISLK